MARDIDHRDYRPERKAEIIAAWKADLAPEAPPARDPEGFADCPDPSNTPVNGGFFHAGADQRDPIACQDEARENPWL